MSDSPTQEAATPSPAATGEGGKPLVSVLVSVYKTAEEHLRATIESVLNQTYPHFELVLLDDCPSQPSESIIRSYNDPRIRYEINEKNLGISGSRNRLIEMARGEFIAILDHDDVCMPQRFEKEVNYLLEHPDVGVVSAQMRYIPHGRLATAPEKDHDIKVALTFSCAMAHSCAMVRRDLLIRHNIRYEEFFSPAEDHRLWARLIPYTNFYNIQEPLLEYRLHVNNTSRLQEEKLENAHWNIRAGLMHDQPGLVEEAHLLARQVTRYYFLGITLFKTVRYRDVTKVYLFSKIPVLRIKRKTHL